VENSDSGATNALRLSLAVEDVAAICRHLQQPGAGGGASAGEEAWREDAVDRLGQVLLVARDRHLLAGTSRPTLARPLRACWLVCCTCGCGGLSSSADRARPAILPPPPPLPATAHTTTRDAIDKGKMQDMAPLLAPLGPSPLLRLLLS